MSEGQVGVGIRRERRRARRVEINRGLLCLGLCVLEGVLASLIVLLSALIYHDTFAGIPLHGQSLWLYLGYATLTGILYGASAAISASRFLDDILSQQGGLADSMLGWTMAFAMALLIAFLFGLSSDLSRVSLTSAFLVGAPVLLGTRGLVYSALRAYVHQGQLQYRRIGVIGSEIDIARFLVNSDLWRVGYRLAGSMPLENIQNADGTLRKDTIQETGQNWVALGTQHVVVVGELNDVDALEELTNEFKRFSVSVIGVPATDNTSLRFLDIVPLGHTGGGVRVLRAPLNQSAVLIKRVFDLCVAIVGLVLLAPIFLLTAMAIRLESAGPVFFKQARRGFNGETFYIWKFRSMNVAESGSAMTQASKGDSRITRVGRFIRATSVDELPQFINVLRGEMSAVGPRPHALMHDSELALQLEKYAHRQRIKPGITGWAQINGYRGATSTFAHVEGRTEHDLYYIDNWSIFLDFWILLLTVFSRKARHNAF
ncbi:exopolysaccharide biosynthesis polyprenyl glycosylphosphotransferase [Devosia sp. A449]